MIVDQSMKLTKDEAAELMGEVDAVLEARATRSRGRASGGTRGGDRERRTYVFYAMVQPYPRDATGS